MKSKYKVVIKATIIKPVYVVAESEEEATIMAHEQFSTLNEGIEERYEEETLEVQKEN